MAFVTNSNRPQPLWQPPQTACLTASVPPLRPHASLAPHGLRRLTCETRLAAAYLECPVTWAVGLQTAARPCVMALLDGGHRGACVSWEGRSIRVQGTVGSCSPFSPMQEGSDKVGGEGQGLA